VQVISYRSGGRGFPPLVYLALAGFALFFLVAALLTSTRILLLGRNTDATVVDVSYSRRIASVTIEYRTEDGQIVRSSRGGFNTNELADLMAEVGRYGESQPFEAKNLIGATVPIRYATGRPTMAHIRRWVPLYREFVSTHIIWMVCAGLAVLTFRLREKR
jgi:hypothetical protein